MREGEREIGNATEERVVTWKEAKGSLLQRNGGGMEYAPRFGGYVKCEVWSETRKQQVQFVFFSMEEDVVYSIPSSIQCSTQVLVQ